VSDTTFIERRIVLQRSAPALFDTALEHVCMPLGEAPHSRDATIEHAHHDYS